MICHRRFAVFLVVATLWVACSDDDIPPPQPDFRLTPDVAQVDVRPRPDGVASDSQRPDGGADGAKVDGVGDSAAGDRGPVDTATPKESAVTDSTLQPDLTRDAEMVPDVRLDYGANDPCRGVTPVPGRPALKATQIVSTNYRRLVDLAFVPGDNRRLFVLEQHAGQVHVVEDGQAQPTPAIDIGSRLSTGNEQGLLAIAFHPSYAQNHKLYLFYTDKSRAVQIKEFRTQTNNDNIIDLGSERHILKIDHPQSNHNGGALRFGPDGYLYISMGDGGGGGDNHGTIGNGQRKDTLLGKILRIDVDSQPGGKPYAVPADNPFVNDGSYSPEIYHLGLRNPFRFSFDRETGAMWIADVGQNAWEEIDYVAPGQSGKNFGWRCREGLVPYNMSTSNCNAGGFVDPVIVHPTNDPFCSIIMGFVYRGCKMPGYRGTAFYSDYCVSNPRRFDFVGGQVQNDQAITTVSGNPVAWAEDDRGELYFVTLGNKVYRLDPA